MFVLVGLGNPGATYASHRHNVGFQAIDAIASAFSVPSFQKKEGLLLSDGQICKNRVFLLKPQTFMNLSGKAVAPLLSFYKIPLSQCFVFHDDLDLALGRVKVKLGGGDGGHNGLKSLDQHMGKNYPRVRLGIDRPPLKEMVSSYVLNNFTNAEQKVTQEMFAGIVQNIELLLTNDFPLFMTRLSEWMREEA